MVLIYLNKFTGYMSNYSNYGIDKAYYVGFKMLKKLRQIIHCIIT